MSGQCRPPRGLLGELPHPPGCPPRGLGGGSGNGSEPTAVRAVRTDSPGNCGRRGNRPRYRTGIGPEGSEADGGSTATEGAGQWVERSGEGTPGATGHMDPADSRARPRVIRCLIQDRGHSEGPQVRGRRARAGLAGTRPPGKEGSEEPS